jgi:steroid delta-isomerase-like uncharacterized protein
LTSGDPFVVIGPMLFDRSHVHPVPRDPGADAEDVHAALVHPVPSAGVSDPVPLDERDMAIRNRLGGSSSQEVGQTQPWLGPASSIWPLSIPEWIAMAGRVLALDPTAVPFAGVAGLEPGTRNGGRRRMDRDEMLRLFEAHRKAEAARDIDAILETFVADPFMDTMPLGLRSDGRDAVRAAYESQFFTAFPDLAPEDEGMALGEDVIAVWGTLRGTSRGDWLGVPPGGESFVVPFANVVPFRQGRMAGETIYFDLATLCEQARIPLEDIRAAAAARRGGAPAHSPRS